MVISSLVLLNNLLVFFCQRLDQLFMSTGSAISTVVRSEPKNLNIYVFSL